MPEIIDLGIDTNNLNPKQVEALKRSVSNAFEHNKEVREEEMGAARATIQRRGLSYPGDTGDNFGLGGSSLHGPAMWSPFADTWPGSYFFSGQFGGYSPEGTYGTPYGMGMLSMYAQGSHSYLRRNTRLAYHKMAACVSAYKGFGLAKNVIDLMANFASEGLKIKHPNKNIERFLQRWAFHTDLQNRFKDGLRYYYKFGNVFIYRTMGKIDKKTYDRLRRSKANQLSVDGKIYGFEPVYGEKDPVSDPQQTERIDDADEQSKKPIGEKEIPWTYTFLNPFQMELRGTKFFGKQRWVFILDPMTVNDISRALVSRNSVTDFLDDSEVNLPPEFMKLSKKISNESREDEKNEPNIVDLDQSKLYTIHYMKDDHEDWADPMLWPVMADILYKNKLRQMDMSVCNSVINAVTIFKLGDIKNGYIADKEDMRRFSEFLRAPTQAMQMVWNDAISIEDSFPPVDKILGAQKYEAVNADILRGIGIPDTLVGGTNSSNFSTSFLGVRTLLERLEEGRNVFKRWLLKELELLVRSLGIRRMPTVKFGKMSLRDEKAEKQLIIQLLDRNIISIEAVLETFGEDFEIELERMREEQEIRESTGLIQKHSPYVDPINDMDTEEQMEKEAELKRMEQKLALRMKQKEKKNARDKNGRPGGSDGIPQEKKRETKPQGMAQMLEYERVKDLAFKRINKIEGVLAKRLLQTLGKKNKRQLTKGESKALETMTYVVASKLRSSVDEDKIFAILGDKPSMDSKVYSCFSKLCESNMTLADRKRVMATSIACVSMEE